MRWGKRGGWAALAVPPLQSRPPGACRRPSSCPSTPGVGQAGMGPGCQAPRYCTV